MIAEEIYNGGRISYAKFSLCDIILLFIKCKTTIKKLLWLNQNFFSLCLWVVFQEAVFLFHQAQENTIFSNLSMFSYQDPFCKNEHIACNDAEILRGGWESCLAHIRTDIFFLIQFYSLIELYFCFYSNQSSRCKWWFLNRVGWAFLGTSCCRQWNS